MHFWILHPCIFFDVYYIYIWLFFFFILHMLCDDKEEKKKSKSVKNTRFHCFIRYTFSSFPDSSYWLYILDNPKSFNFLVFFSCRCVVYINCAGEFFICFRDSIHSQILDAIYFGMFRCIHKIILNLRRNLIEKLE